VEGSTTVLAVQTEKVLGVKALVRISAGFGKVLVGIPHVREPGTKR